MAGSDDIFDGAVDGVVEILGNVYAENEVENRRIRAQTCVVFMREFFAELRAKEQPVALAVDGDVFAGSGFFSYGEKALSRLSAFAAAIDGGAVTKLYSDPMCDGSERAAVVATLRVLCQRLGSNAWKDTDHLADVLETNFAQPIDALVGGYRLMKAALERMRDLDCSETIETLPHAAVGALQDLAEEAVEKVDTFFTEPRVDALFYRVQVANLTEAGNLSYLVVVEHPTRPLDAPLTEELGRMTVLKTSDPEEARCEAAIWHDFLNGGGSLSLADVVAESAGPDND